MANEKGINFQFNQLRPKPKGNVVPVENRHRVLWLPDLNHFVFLPDRRGWARGEREERERENGNIERGGDRIWPQIKHFLFKLCF